MNQIIVVEGKNDYSKILEVYKDATVITTNGREISDETLNLIKEYSLTNEIILFLDPDNPGEQIRNRILSVVPNCSHAFLPKKEGISKNKRKVGIEHAKASVIKECLDKVYKNNDSKYTYGMSDLYNLGLVGSENSKELRDFVSSKLNIGTPNAKTFLKRINSFNISIDKVKELINLYGNNES